MIHARSLGTGPSGELLPGLRRQHPGQVIGTHVTHPRPSAVVDGGDDPLVDRDRHHIRYLAFTKAIAPVLRADLVAAADIGPLPVAGDAEGLSRLVDAAYEKRSIAISSNRHPSGSDELMPKTLRHRHRLLHHAHVCQTRGDSVRLTQALAGQGEPLDQLASRPVVANPRADPVATAGQFS